MPPQLTPLLSVPFPMGQTAANRSKSKKSDQRPIFLLQLRAGFHISRLTQGSGRSSGVEHNLAKVRVESSNLFARSNSLYIERGQFPSDLKSEPQGKRQTHVTGHAERA